MPTQAPHPRLSWHLPASYIAVLAWGLLYACFARDAVCDEPGHLFDMEHFAAAKAGVPFGMTMLPGYHFVVNTLTGGHPTLFAARMVSMGFALLMLVTFCRLRQLICGRHNGMETLLLVFFPLLQPFGGMAYTDVPGVATLFLAFWAYTRGNAFLTLLSLLLACLVRQSNLAWGLFFLADSFLRRLLPSLPTGGPTRLATAVWRHAWAALRAQWGVPILFAAGLAALLYFGRLTLDTGHGNSWRPNIATLYTGGWLALLLGLPVWILRLPGWLSSIYNRSAQRPIQVFLAAVALLGTAYGLHLAFQNPHIWNRELFWPDCRFTLLRNWPLVWAEKYTLFRLASAFNVVVMTVALVVEIRRQPRRLEISLIAALGILLLCTSLLVEPRYFIPPVALALCYWQWERRIAAWIAGWFAVLCLLHGPFIGLGLSLW